MSSPTRMREMWSIIRQDYNSADLYTAFMLVLYGMLAVVLHQSIHGSVTALWTNVLVLTLLAFTIVLRRLTGSAAVGFVRHF